MTDFNLDDEELHEILGLSSEQGYIPTFTAKPVVNADTDSLSSVQDISQDEASMDNLIFSNSDNKQSSTGVTPSLPPIATLPPKADLRPTTEFTPTFQPKTKLQTLKDPLDLPQADQLERILLKLEENTTTLNGMENEFKKQLYKREDQNKIQQDMLDIVFNSLICRR